MMRIPIIFVLFVSLLSCTKKPIEQPKAEPPVKESVYVWRQLIYPDNTELKVRERGGFSRFVGENKILTYLLPLAQNNVVTLKLFDTKEQKFLWEWKDYYPDGRQTPNGSWFYDGVLYISSEKEQYYISLETGETLLKYRINTTETVEGGCTVLGDKIFHIRRRGVASSPYETTLYMSTKMSKDWEPVFKLVADDGYSAGMELPVAHVNSSGDTILYFQNRRYRSEYPWYSIDFYAYNLTKKEILWKQEKISTIVSNIDSPVMDEANNRIYFKTRYTMFCWDMETGEEIWHNELDYAGLLSSDYIFNDGKVITVTDQGYLIAFDGATGQRLYYEKKGGCCVSGIRVHKDKIYYSDTELFVSDLNTGKTIWQPGVYGGFNGAPVFDDAKGVMYIMGRYYMYAMKIPE